MYKKGDEVIFEGKAYKVVRLLGGDQVEILGKHHRYQLSINSIRKREGDAQDFNPILDPVFRAETFYPGAFDALSPSNE